MPDPRTSGAYPEVTDQAARGRTIPPGGPISPEPMGYENPGATPNLRGVEANTNPSKGDPLEMPESLGAGKHGSLDGAPELTDMAQAGMTYEAGVDVPKSDRRATDFPEIPTRSWATSDLHNGGADV